jgi:hypothetical protein
MYLGYATQRNTVSVFIILYINTLNGAKYRYRYQNIGKKSYRSGTNANHGFFRTSANFSNKYNAIIYQTVYHNQYAEGHNFCFRFKTHNGQQPYKNPKGTVSVAHISPTSTSFVKLYKH